MKRQLSWITLIGAIVLFALPSHAELLRRVEASGEWVLRDMDSGLDWLPPQRNLGSTIIAPWFLPRARYIRPRKNMSLMIATVPTSTESRIMTRVS